MRDIYTIPDRDPNPPWVYASDDSEWEGGYEPGDCERDEVEGPDE